VLSEATTVPVQVDQSDASPPAAAVTRVNFRQLLPGDPAPWFRQRTSANPRFTFDTTAGRWLVLLFHGSASDAGGKAAWNAVLANRRVFDDVKASLFAVSIDPADESEGRIGDTFPGIRVFWDFDAAVSRLYGALPQETGPGSEHRTMRRFWVVLDPTLRVQRVIPFAGDGSDRDEIIAYVDGLPPPEHFAGVELMAPVLYLPNVLEPALCRRLVDLYEKNGGEESGFMREVDGKTVGILDRSHKSRSDWNIDDQDLIRALQARVHRRVVPEIEKVHQFKVTRMERYIVGCYTAEDAGHFRPHRDNTTGGTAHRRFALSVNLNSAFEGGELCFPEYGPRRFKPPPGAAVVFSCSLLHTVSTVTAGRRYAFLPFLYDDAAARQREANNAKLGDGVGEYHA
jgi:peroxiredoxin/predicted 2-oxoglutarate/Fe(II)-dependent dioxygenase YbiX